MAVTNLSPELLDSMTESETLISKGLYLGSEFRFKAGKIVWLLLVLALLLVPNPGPCLTAAQEPNFLVYHREFENSS